jgi:hypothetical protein
VSNSVAFRGGLAALFCGMACLAGAQTQLAKPRPAAVPPGAEQVLVIGDSITEDWTDMPVRASYSGRQACVLRLHMAAAIAQNPQIKIVVIEAGTDDILQSPGSGFDCPLPLQDATTSVVDMVKTAQATGRPVFVLSVLPISWNNRASQPCAPLVPPFNAALQSAITAAGAYWVDNYDSFVGNTAQYQIDGVHPSEAGFQVMEQNLETAICTNLDCGQNLRRK